MVLFWAREGKGQKLRPDKQRCTGRMGRNLPTWTKWTILSHAGTTWSRYVFQTCAFGDGQASIEKQ